MSEKSGIFEKNGMLGKSIISEKECNDFIVTVFGYSDDLVDIEGSSYPEYEIDCFDRDVRLWFDDGTVILISYAQTGVWKICVEDQGDAPQRLTVCDAEDADIYSDIFEINAEVIRHQVIRKR